DDARTYEQDTGVAILSLGFPLLPLPPSSLGKARGGFNRRIIAPIAVLPLALTIRQGPSPSIELACRGDGVDLVIPNTALLAWLQQQTTKPPEEVFADDQGADPWREINELVQRICQLIELPPPSLTLETLQLLPAPKSDDAESKQPAILPSAVLGLFPMANQGLLCDTQAMVEGEPIKGPIESFLKVDVTLDLPPAPHLEKTATTTKISPRPAKEQRLITRADPCQRRAVSLARNSSGLVVHGPPGTGKSQTITNIIGDHLIRGQRILFVCDKRTALDVVANRLEHMGLGKLCGLVHDPQRDQRDLYRALREQLETLSDAATDPKAEARLNKVDEELQQLHDELLRHWSALMEPAPQHGSDESFHNLMGRWLAEPQPADLKLNDSNAAALNLPDLDKHQRDVRELLERAQRAQYPKNQWVEAHGLDLQTYLARPMQEIRSTLAKCLDSAHSADTTIHPAIPPFDPTKKLTEQAETRTLLADHLDQILKITPSDTRAYWATQPERNIQDTAKILKDLEPYRAALSTAPRDPELSLLIKDQPPPVQLLAYQIATLATYIQVSSRWYSFLAIFKKLAASTVLKSYGLTLSLTSARRLHTFLTATRARVLLKDARLQLLGDRPNQGTPADDSLLKFFCDNSAIVNLLDISLTDPALQPHAAAIRIALTDSTAAANFLEGLHRSPARAKAITDLLTELRAANLFSSSDPKNWLGKLLTFLCKNGPASPTLQRLADSLDTLEDVLRVPEQLNSLPASLRNSLQSLIDQSAGPDSALQILRRAALANAISNRLRHDPQLQLIDDQRLKSTFDRYRLLEDQKMSLVRDAILHQWVSRQKDRLLASTGSRLNSLGADLRRRLTSRGQKAMRLRQVIQVGQEMHAQNENENASDGDPLFDLCPVWMASPETVAQIFPRKPLFDIVIFDEASQCRLEEGLPVLTRASRVVIAGDPRQLPPSRFFESAIITTDDEEPQSDQDLFESHQGEVEDLLQAALNLQIEQCYLDVHYRSRNADLIQFSNAHFYGSRLQPIPGHPANRTTVAPIRLYQINGIYYDRTNEPEADQVTRIVHDLLRRADPPSIGIACFNLDQRDLIVEKLEALASTDPDFARRLTIARSRRGAGSFEGLFVKNLENVQGDERDHIIISTTYGPDKTGRFYKRFGPLGSAGGGRRLNVLVTRARQEVHVVTSIPPQIYQNLPPIPPTQSPGGGYLLFSYLAYAQQLAHMYNAPDESRVDTAHHPSSDELESVGSASADGESPSPPSSSDATVNVLPSRSPSLFSESLANHLAQKHNIGSDVHWGNDGFCVDLALHHPHRPDDVTLGILCDGARYRQADDPIEWDLFRTAIHESQGWKLQRLWTPHFFRDPEGIAFKILRQSQLLISQEPPQDALRVTSADS
ncbi:MAG TPA: AAA domain-containing protein, partial [Tepidisphaeraceae bacterium]|nr:AAA domain-containing protein [Tepidisphaeraceae bacterium]